jgi:hypothetical protein
MTFCTKYVSAESTIHGKLELLPMNKQLNLMTPESRTYLYGPFSTMLSGPTAKSKRSHRYFTCNVLVVRFNWQRVTWRK